MYNVITPAGNIHVETLAEAMEYRKLYGYFYQKIIEPSNCLHLTTYTDGDNFQRCAKCNKIVD